MARVPFEGEDELALEQGVAEANKKIDKMIAAYTPRKMNLIGSASKTCTSTRIFKEEEKNSINLLKVFYYDKGVHSLLVRLTNNELNFFGNQSVTGLKATEFVFDNGSQLLGIYGKIAFDDKQP